MINSPIYLHFFDRELRTVEQAEFTDSEIFSIVFYANFLTTSHLYLGNSIIWESANTFPKSIDLLKELELIGYVRFVSSHNTIDEFLSSREKMYLHDKQRYLMYFAKSNDFWGKSPLIAVNSTTKILQKNIRNWLEEEAKTTILLKKIESLDEALRKKEEKAITISLFKQHVNLNKDEEIILARLISMFYTRRYVDFLNGTIMTGIRRLFAYEEISNKNFPNYDYPIFYTLIHSILFNNIDLEEMSPMQCSLLINKYKNDVCFKPFLLECKNIVNAIKMLSPDNNIQNNRGKILQFIKYDIGKHLSKNEMSTTTDGLGYLQTIKYGLSSQYPLIKELQMENLNKKVLLVVATMLELQEITNFYAQKHSVPSFSIGSHTYWNLGIINNSEIFLCKTAMGAKGQSGAILGVKDAIDAINPDYIIQVGLCFGLKPSKQKLSEVLVSSILQDYEPAKNTANGIVPRGERIPANATLIDRFESAYLDWDETKTEIHFGLILTGEKLSDSEEFVNSLKEAFPDAIGGEMEGGGLLASAHRESKGWILVKGICDWGFNKDDDLQKQAVQNAIEFVNFTLEKSVL